MATWAVWSWQISGSVFVKFDLLCTSVTTNFAGEKKSFQIQFLIWTSCTAFASMCVFRKKTGIKFYSGQEPAAQCLLCSQRGKPPLLFCSNGISNKNLGLGGIRIKSSLKKIFLPVIPDIFKFLCRQNFNLNQTDFSPTLKYQQEGPQYFFCYLIFSMPGAVQQCMCTPMLIVYTSACQ